MEKKQNIPPAQQEGFTKFAAFCSTDAAGDCAFSAEVADLYNYNGLSNWTWFTGKQHRVEQDSPPPPPAAWAGGLDTRFKPLSKGSELYLNVLFYFSFLPHSLSMSFQKNMRHKNSDIISCYVHRKLPKIVTLSTYNIYQSKFSQFHNPSSRTERAI